MDEWMIVNSVELGNTASKKKNKNMILCDLDMNLILIHV